MRGLGCICIFLTRLFLGPQAEDVEHSVPRFFRICTGLKREEEDGSVEI